MNSIEKYIIKRLAQNLVKDLPDIKEEAQKKGKKILQKYTQIIKAHTEELYFKIEVTIIKLIEKYENELK